MHIYMDCIQENMDKDMRITIAIDEELDTLLSARAAELKVSVSDVVRMALVRYFKGASE